MASALVRRSIAHNSRCFKFPPSWCLSKLLPQHSAINKAVSEDAIHIVSNRVSFHSQVAGGGGLPSSMRGVVFWESGKPMTIEEFHIPRPKAGEILIKTKGMESLISPRLVFMFVFDCLQIYDHFDFGSILGNKSRRRLIIQFMRSASKNIY